MASPGAYLLVEGKDDRHVLWALFKQHGVSQSFSVETPGTDEADGLEALLQGLPLRLKAENLGTLGVVLDADEDLTARWQAVSARLRAAGVRDIPDAPGPEGWISPGSPRLGVWLMPDNRLPGILEDFAVGLVPASPEGWRCARPARDRGTRSVPEAPEAQGADPYLAGVAEGARQAHGTSDNGASPGA